MSALVARQYLPIGDARGSTEVPAALRRYVRAIGDVVKYVTGTVTLTRTEQVIAVTGGTYTITMPASPQDGDEHQFIYASGSGTVTLSDGGSFSQTIDAVGEVLTAYYDKTAWVVVEDNRTVWGGGDVTLGNLSVTGTLGVTGEATFSAGATLSSASPTFTVGNGSGAGSASIVIIGGTTGDAYHRLRLGANVVWNFGLTTGGGGADYVWDRYVGGVYVDSPIRIYNATGNLALTGAIDVGGASTLGAWKIGTVEQTITTADLTDADTSQDVAITGFPTNAYPLHGRIVVNTEFSGGTVATCTMALGDAADPNGLMAEEDIFTGAGTGSLVGTDGIEAGMGTAALEAAYSPIAQVVTTGGNLDTLTAGSAAVKIYYLGLTT